MTSVLVLNAGSSSVKFKLISFPDEVCTISGIVERIGEPGSPFSSHSEAMAEVLSRVTSPGDIHIVGHRVVHGGVTYQRPVVIDDGVEEVIDSLASLAPLHNPANLAGIIAARRLLPHVPHVAAFDTGYFSALSPAAYTYALPRSLTSEFGLRKYGFHGHSHHYVSLRMQQLLRHKPESTRVISFHLGNGSSVTAIRGGVPIDTSMGFTPLPGLVMGTRSGDLDPSILIFLQREKGMTVQEIDHMLNRQSGLLALSGVSDMREVLGLMERGDAQAREAIDLWSWRARHYLGGYLAQLGGLDAIAFTGGIGENSSFLRSEVCRGLEQLGITVDSQLNRDGVEGERKISTPGGLVEAWVIPTDEELHIARQSVSLLAAP